MKDDKILIDPIDEALRFVYLNAEQNTIDTSVELNRITEAKYPVVISAEKAKEMIKSLYENLAVDSLGVLITNALEKTNIKVEEAARESRLPITTLEQLQADVILANSIPVISLKTLLKALKIPFNKAEEAIMKTFHILKNEMVFSPATINSMQLTYRRRNAKGASSFNTKANKSEKQYLFQNEEALTKYLKRLDELYSVL